jgi:hypothetical protein
MPCITEVDHTLKFIRNTYSGIITKEDLNNVWHHLLSLKEFTELKYNLLSDYRDSRFEIALEEGSGMLQFLMSIKDILNGKKEAAILKDPKDTALSMSLAMKTYAKVGYIVELFSTEEAALNWLAK